MQLRLILSVLLLCNSFWNHAQEKLYYNQRPEFLKANSVWAFGNGAGLNFNGGSAKAIHTEMFCNEGSASVADPVTGKLLFYSNGGQVWNAKHQWMPNGDSLLGNLGSQQSAGDIGAYSTAQGVCIVPVIGTSDQYYLFSLSGNTSGGPKPPTSWGNGGTLFYNVVDMSLDGGLGDIPLGKKNIVLNSGDFLSECMIAIPGNNCDVWLLVYKHRPTEEFMAYHITKDGIDTVPVISASLPPLTTNKLRPYLARARTTLAVSPDRSKIAMANFIMPYATILGEFDPNTGHVNNLMTISDNVDSSNVVTGYSACFSPDGSKLYIGGMQPAKDELKGTISKKTYEKNPAIYQYDLSVYSSSAISNSIQNVGFIPADTNIFWMYDYYGQDFGMMALYDDAIYVVSIAYIGVGGRNAYVHSIDNPDLAGVACGFQANSVSLLTGSSTMLGLHNNVVFPLYDTINALVLDTTVCRANEDLVLKPIDGNKLQYFWDDGTTESSRVIDKAGTYWVIKSDGCHTFIDTFKVKGFDFPEPIININVLELGIAGNFNYNSYQWLLNGKIISGATNRTYIVSENGDYQVIVSNEYGCTDTSEVYKVTNVTGVTGIHPLAEQIMIYPNPVSRVLHVNAPVVLNLFLCSIEGKILKEAQKSNQVSMQDLSEGIYFLQVYDQEGRLLKIEKVIKTL